MKWMEKKSFTTNLRLIIVFKTKQYLRYFQDEMYMFTNH